MTTKSDMIFSLIYPDIVPGENIGVYSIMEGLDSTNNSIVLRADNIQTGGKVAMKLINKTTTPHENIEQESFNMCYFNHPNIIRGFDFFEKGRFSGFFMDFAEMGDLLDYVCDNPRFSENFVRHLSAQIVDAILHIHNLGFVHRDIKLENFLLKTGGIVPTVLLADFGYMKQLAVNELFPGNTACGTVAYMAPEVLMRQRHGAPADIWSFGVTLYALLTRRMPFPDAEIEDPRRPGRKIVNPTFIHDVTNGSYFQDHLVDCSDEAKDVIARCLAVNPDQRITAQKLAMHPFFPGIKPDPEPDPLPEPEPEPFPF
ncbi:Serine/threonine-protein kinase SAPK2 [Tritrichomonas foetus]|uniref:Serine/threonine-protein kinase SAPK2 n=1 Tax=Tritrichomonas foetus TaxID=1144522 RepID=A0A1J4K769_9EUKA|nr:Serine/threonine-protein kinase SAPK2 [Tritrichomonas foetus]|eukprot:OHT06834.1 Serine/threonine-protein kinase SAPK2 [Tritrichomonas foetus]